MESTFHIPAAVPGFASMGHLVSCQKCGRKVLVGMGLIGVPHHTNLAITCADCLEIDDEFKQKYPEIAKQIEDWKNDVQS